MVQLSIDCGDIAPELRQHCLMVAGAILKAAGVTPESVCEARRALLVADGSESRARLTAAEADALAAFNLAELSARAESGRGEMCRLLLVERLH